MEKILKILFFISLLFLVYVAGLFSGVYTLYPYQKARQVHQYLEAKKLEETIFKREVIYSYLWNKTRDKNKGVTLYNKKKASDGVTLVQNNDGTARLVDMEGKILHEWHIPIKALWGKNDYYMRYKNFFFIHKLIPLPDGSAYAVIEASFSKHYGKGVVKLDKDSNVIWAYKGHAHHNADIAPDSLVILESVIQKENPYPELKKVTPPFFDEYVTFLDLETGEKKDSISIFQMLLDSQYAYMAGNAWFSEKSGDYLHPNKAEYIDAKRAALMPFAQEGDVLLSIRNPGIVAVLDVAKRKIKWAMRGDWYMQHDPDILENGNFLIFDNMGLWNKQKEKQKKKRARARVIEVDPKTKKVVWQYSGSKKRPSTDYQTVLRGSQQVLPNGNILVTFAAKGRVEEITREGEIVWEYYSDTFRNFEGDFYRGVLMKARRYYDDYFTFLK
jgi:uncharacterized protein (UPF0333 family)